MDDCALPGPKELALLWVVHIALVAWGAWLGSENCASSGMCESCDGKVHGTVTVRFR